MRNHYEIAAAIWWDWANDLDSPIQKSRMWKIEKGENGWEVGNEEYGFWVDTYLDAWPTRPEVCRYRKEGGDCFWCVEPRNWDTFKCPNPTVFPERCMYR